MIRFLFYTHSLVSDWNHGNAHFLRGVMRELQRRGYQATALEPEDGWSRRNLVAQQGVTALDRFSRDYPDLSSVSYGENFAHEEMLSAADVVVVHEWTDPHLIARIARARRRTNEFTLLFHDTHHRAVSAADEIGALALDEFDLILAFGEVLRQRYLEAGWGRQVVTWHEAADTSIFRPHQAAQAFPDSEIVWIGNWGDEERSAELHSYLIGPALENSLRGNAYGVRYPREAREALEAANLRYRGWTANADVPAIFARHRATVHIPRRPYASALPGIPTIRVFEALACGIPLVCAPWSDCEGLFRPGKDLLVAADKNEMSVLLRDAVNDKQLSQDLARSGLETIRQRHSCAHRVEELLKILAQGGTERVRSSLANMEAIQ
jgi:spore maturation protein CgeB